ncbi:MAG: DUF429 domain-containing protein [Burkholderiales bacterium PBB3]|nr:MAG: DUF429 domain-containing protein [Burkholderiales bacterium PBB3]
MHLIGCDFSSSPTRRKPIVVAHGGLRGAAVVLERLERLDTLDAFSAWLQQPDAWVGGFDLPFGLSRELIVALGWPQTWEASIRYYAQLSRADIRTQFKAFCDSRPAGGKFAHRACDRPAGSSPSMKWVNPPVAYMLHAGVPRLLDAGVTFPGMHESADPRIALEAYPGLLAREVLGQRSYKSDTVAKQTSERLIARKDLITALEAGQSRLGLRIKLSHAQRDALAEDASGDSLDAVLCLVQAAWGWVQQMQGQGRYGLPAGFDPLEGWIVSARG